MVAWVLFAANVARAGTPSWSQLASDDGWSHDSDNATKDGETVAVFTKTIASVPCFRASTEVSGATAQTMAGVAADILSATRWSTAGVTDAKVLAKSGSSVDYYQYLDVPGWTLAADRFWFLHGVTENKGSDWVFHWERLVDGGSYATTWQDVKTAHPSAVEPPVNVGAWWFTDAGGDTKVQYRICTDSGGSIPQSIQTAATRHTLPDTVADLVREARRRTH